MFIVKLRLINDFQIDNLFISFQNTSFLLKLILAKVNHHVSTSFSIILLICVRFNQVSLSCYSRKVYSANFSYILNLKNGKIHPHLKCSKYLLIAQKLNYLDLLCKKVHLIKFQKLVKYIFYLTKLPSIFKLFKKYKESAFAFTLRQPHFLIILQFNQFIFTSKYIILLLLKHKEQHLCNLQFENSFLSNGQKSESSNKTQRINEGQDQLMTLFIKIRVNDERGRMIEWNIQII
ncbi:unnamed protein product (macronuclear) [Paramecium tetraurelia]|uniref:Transmembrane protein n=1 Tax=Paramecium tetraurelia TaxID=5888 RepID=A0CHG6_PARTE|nr:uncharacterized protein GSPATT00038335001 [Paramecium tetraurelia]CAK70233.1 unnamed protein product [Paramecium tetraurelia]|eukprot:XP_001437630.1 hypothetical protein (macronuclear) [Paramecium tetraurelia strain d4-2]